MIQYPYVPSRGGKLMISGLSCTFESSCTCIGLGAGKLIPESDLTEKLLTNDFPEDKLVMEPDRIDTSMLFKEALKVDLISLSIFFCLLKKKFLDPAMFFFCFGLSVCVYKKGFLCNWPVNCPLRENNFVFQ